MTRLFALLTVLLLLVSTAHAQKLGVGDSAPDFTAEGVDGKSYSLKSFADAKALVVCFTCNSCPVAVQYEDRFIEFAKSYQDQGVKFVAINVNPEDLEAMKTRSQEKGFNFPYVKDPTGASAKAFAARVTPHLYVLDKDRKVAYMGKFDDHTIARKVEQKHVEDAVKAVLAGKTPELTSTRPVGCQIQLPR